MLIRNKIKDEYNPDISALIDQTDEDWGDPETNASMLIPYGITPIDRALYGIDVNGDLNVIMGQEKNRKTTLWINFLINIMVSSRPEKKPLTAVDALESGMNPFRYRDQLISNLATRILLNAGHAYRKFCPMCDQPKCRHLGLSPEFLRYKKRTEWQQAAIDEARELIRTWPIKIYGAHPKMGDTRNLAKTAVRWRRLIEEEGMQIGAVDHVQQYAFAEALSDYDKQTRAVEVHGELASLGIANFVISQISLTSVREYREGKGEKMAAGGAKLNQEANTVFDVEYIDGSGRMTIKIQRSRKAGTFAVEQNLEDTSGAFYGKAYRMGGEESDDQKEDR